jgi:hypothetical protein
VVLRGREIGMDIFMETVEEEFKEIVHDRMQIKSDDEDE